MTARSAGSSTLPLPPGPPPLLRLRCVFPRFQGSVSPGLGEPLPPLEPSSAAARPSGSSADMLPGRDKQGSSPGRLWTPCSTRVLYGTLPASALAQAPPGGAQPGAAHPVPHRPPRPRLPAALGRGRLPPCPSHSAPCLPNWAFSPPNPKPRTPQATPQPRPLQGEAPDASWPWPAALHLHAGSASAPPAPRSPTLSAVQPYK